MKKAIRIQGAREHNLKNITLDLPKEKFIVVTGLSGSGKSTLAFDTLYAEGQRRYVESLSAYARQFLELMPKPDVDSIEGLSPAISIEQKTTSRNPRSTVGTITEIYDYLRLLYARIGIPYSPTTGKPIESQSASQIIEKIFTLEENKKIYLLAPIIRGRKGEYKKNILDLGRQGYQRFKIDGAFYTLEEIPVLDKNVKHDISVVVDRLAIKHTDDFRDRLADSVETCLKLGEELLIVEDATTKEQHLYSEKFACPETGFTLEEIEPRLFSFNSPYGACPSCDGLGSRHEIDPKLVIPNVRASLLEGAVAPWALSQSRYYSQTLEGIARHFSVKMTTAFEDLPKKVQNVILYGSGKEKLNITYDDGRKPYTLFKKFEGVIPNLKRRFLETENDKIREDISRYQTFHNCEDCGGHRLNEKALCVKIKEKHIGEVTRLSIEESQKWFEHLPSHLSKQEKTIAQRILKEIQERLKFLVSVGLGYLTLSRTAGTLSGGEAQRIRLASQIGSGLTGVLYVLDEPSIGLHQRDNQMLLDTLKHLRNLDNTVVVVEHDEDAIRQADHVIDMGPGAGVLGGEIIAQGTAKEIEQCKKSLTGAYLSGRKEITVPKNRRKAFENNWITLKGASGNNLKDVTVKIPQGTLTCVTGVSGSGKSTLVMETLYRVLKKFLYKSPENPSPYKGIEGISYIDKVIKIDQNPIGRTPRSNPATYTGIFTPIREWFAALPAAKAKGFSPGRFSFNVKGGRCAACQGDGLLKIEMHFLPDVYVTCDQCKGKRYNPETLSVQYKGKTIADVLDLTVDEATSFFEHTPSIYNKLAVLQQVGLGYIKIGQSATTLSGGEAQRIKLSKELGKRSTSKTFYILDEPTTGLHFEDTKKLLEVLHHLVDQGNTVLIIEHNLDVIKTADWLIDLGPEGGNKGGQLLGQGTPEEISKIKKSYTGSFLKSYLKS